MRLPDHQHPRRAPCLFVAPFVFIFSPELPLVGETLAIVERIVTVFCGTAFFAVAAIGHLRQAVPILWRVLPALCSIATFFPAALGGAAAPWISLPAAALGGSLLAVLWAHDRRPGQAVELEGPAGG